MKTLILSLIALTATSFANEKEVSLQEIGHAFSELSEATSFIVKVSPGDELPLNFRMSGDVLSLENPPENGKIKALQPLYVKVEPSFYFSTDKKEWKSFESFFTGQLGVSLGSNQSASGEIYLDLQKDNSFGCRVTIYSHPAQGFASCLFQKGLLEWVITLEYFVDNTKQQSRENVWKMFDQISPHYDLINHLLSFGADFYWRRQLIRHLPRGEGVRLLDLATGTGDQLLTIVKKAKQVQTALGLDLSQEMIRVGQGKIIDKPYAHQVTLMEGDATDISLNDAAVDCITMSFGIRNVTDVDKCLSECFRVLTPCGRLMILEFSLPKNRLIRGFHLTYLRFILPYVAGWISRNVSAYKYLNKTIETFPYGEAFCDTIKKAGFYRVKAYPLTFGAVTLYVGEKGAMRNRLITPPNEILAALLKTPFKPEPFVVNGQEIPYMRLEIPIEIDDIFAFLEAQTLYPKVYWENPEDGIVAGIGSALQLDHLPTFESREGPRFFGGSDFMKRSRNTWGNFPESAYFLPLIQIEKRECGTFLCLNRIQENLDLHLMEEGLLKIPTTMISRLDSPSFPVWEREVNEVLQGIRREDYLKIVLARLTQFEFEEPLSPYAILKNLEGKNRFSFQFSSEATFIGVSPETLYRRKKTRIESAAVAGTRPRGETEAQDQILMNDLINNPKEQHEFQVVKNRIYETLSPLCENLEIQDQKVLKTPTVQHLYHTFQGTLKEGIQDTALIEALHPTPAVGGSPTKEAFNEIRQREQFDRGWYAAPIGWVSPLEAHHLVGIRSALIEKKLLRLFAGTGIVLGSIPSKEWDELEHKIKQYKAFL